MRSFDRRKAIGVWSGHFISDAPAFLVPAAIPAVMEDLGLSYGSAGACVTMMSISMIVFQPLAGYLSRHYTGKRYSRSGLLFLGIVIIGVSVFLESLSRNLAQLIVLQFLVGFGMAFYHPIGYAMVSEICDSNDRGKAFAISESVALASAPVCFASSSLILAYGSWRLIFAMWGFLAVAMSFIVAYSTLGRGRSIESPVKQIKDERHNSLGQIMRRTYIIIAVLAFSEICVATVTTFSSTFLTTTGVSVEYANVIVAIMMIVGSLGTLVIGSTLDRYGERRVVLCAIAIVSLASFFISRTTQISQIIPSMLILALPLWGIALPFYSLISKETDPSSQTATYSIILSIAWGIGGTFPYFAGIMADIFGVQIVFLVVAVSALASSVVVFSSSVTRRCVLNKSDRLRKTV